MTTDGRQRGGVTHVGQRLRALGVGRLPLGFGSGGEQSLQFRETVEEVETEGEETVPKKEVLGALGPVAQEVRDCQPLGKWYARRLWDRRESCACKERLRVLDSHEEVAGGGEQLRRPDLEGGSGGSSGSGDEGAVRHSLRHLGATLRHTATKLRNDLCIIATIALFSLNLLLAIFLFENGKREKLLTVALDELVIFFTLGANQSRK